MNFKYLLLLSAIVAIPAFAKVEKAMTHDSEMMMTQEANPALANDECPDMPAPMLEHAGTKCKVHEISPAHCFKVVKHITREDLYKIPNHSRCECQTCKQDENGEMVCKPFCEKLTCGCEKQCPSKCERCHHKPCDCKPRRCNRCERNNN